MENNPIKFNRPAGLFLCGGGALGSWQSGVLTKLAAAGLDFDVVAGFSVGALNGAAYCHNKTGELGDIWRAIKPGWMFNFSPRYNNMPLELYRRYNSNMFSRAGSMIQNQLARFSLFSDKPLYSLLNGWLACSDATFRKDVEFYAISHAVETKLPYIARFNGCAGGALGLMDALVASCAIPAIFPPVRLSEQGRVYHLVDGGVIGIATINLNIFEGCRTVIMISNTRPEDLAFTGSGFLGYFETRARRMLAVHTDRVYESRVFIGSNPDVHLIAPPEDLGLGLLEFKSEKCARAFAVGEKAGKEFVERLEQGK